MTARAALVVSLDLELHWGVRDHVRPGHRYWRNLEGEREAVTRMLACFEERDVRATWATVGMLFAGSRKEAESFHPRVRPTYAREALDPYAERVGEDEASDPFHYAATLIERLARSGSQELASHTYSHYYSLEPNARPEAFADDLESAQRIARHRTGRRLTSLVLPRNQLPADALDAIRRAGFLCVRGPERGWMYDASPASRKRPHHRAARWLDAHVALRGPVVQAWEACRWDDELVDVRGTHYVRFHPPESSAARLHRRVLRRSMEHATRVGGLVHLWWHPHNLGGDVDAGMACLKGILDDFELLRRERGMESMTMAEAREVALSV